MDDPTPYLWLIPFLPMLASAVTALFGPRFLKQQSHWPCVLGAAGACFFSILTFIAVARGYQGGEVYYTWFSAGRLDVGLGLQADGLTAIMLLVVTFIGSLIVIYSIGYMHGDAGYARYFAVVSLFLGAMTLLVLASNFLVLYAGWEGVGLCSYLLIGHWFTRPAAAQAARKAFLVTRLGDVGLLLGIILLWTLCDYNISFNSIFNLAEFLVVRNGPAGLGLNSPVVTTACLLLFLGAVGKSAQFPLYVWLPDAMQGPSPVSALIHAATMVTAGVYLLARCMPLFVFSPMAQLTVASIGAFTALLAATIALTQWDLKRVLAYSTISQLGYMFMALGSGIAPHGANLAVLLAVSAAIFHLVTHAFFKGLLFLSAGSVMHAMGDVIDMRRFGGLRKVLPKTHLVFLCGAAALAGVPIFFSGFWSKDEILSVTLLASKESQYAVVYRILFYSGLLTAALTAVYTGRAYFLTFWGEERIPPEAGEHVHEAPPVMLYPMMILAAGSILAGILLGPTGIFEQFLERRWLPRFLGEFGSLPDGPNLPLMFGSGLIALGGIGLAYQMVVEKKSTMAAGFARAFGFVGTLSRNLFFVDELYAAFIVKPLEVLAYVTRVFDQYLVDGLVDLAGQVPGYLSGWILRPVQNGLVQFYALLMILGIGGFLLAVLLR